MTTQEGKWELKVEFTSWASQETKTAIYSGFSVGPPPRFKSRKGTNHLMLDAGTN